MGGPLLLPSPPHWLLLRWRHSSALLPAAVGLRQMWHHSTCPKLWIPRSSSRSSSSRTPISLGDPSGLGSEFFLPGSSRRTFLLPAQQSALLQCPWPLRPVHH